MLLPEIITFVIQSLSQFIEDTVSSPIDHTVENLNLTAAILTIIAEQVESQTIVDDIVQNSMTRRSFLSCCNNFCVLLDY
jgi:hypothetical protein